MSVIPSPITVGHVSRQPDTTTTDSHGNHPVTASAVMPRQVQSVAQFGRRGSSRVIFSAETQSREETMLQMATGEPEAYHSGDRVLVGALFDATGTYVPDTGTAYWVDGEPSDERQGPWPSLLRRFGGVVRLKRVT